MCESDPNWNTQNIFIWDEYYIIHNLKLSNINSRIDQDCLIMILIFIWSVLDLYSDFVRELLLCSTKGLQTCVLLYELVAIQNRTGEVHPQKCRPFPVYSCSLCLCKDFWESHWGGGMERRVYGVEPRGVSTCRSWMGSKGMGGGGPCKKRKL